MVVSRTLGIWRPRPTTTNPNNDVIAVARMPLFCVLIPNHQPNTTMGYERERELQAKWQAGKRRAQAYVDGKIEAQHQIDQLTAIITAARKELRESLGLAESELAAEKLSGNVVKAEYWKGELASLQRVSRAIDPQNAERIRAEIQP